MIITDAAPTPPTPDRLGVLTSTLPVVLRSPAVIVDAARVATIAAEWAGVPWPAAGWDDALHWRDPARPDRTLNVLLLLDALNFCFWADPAQPRWGVRWAGRWVNGYAAEAAALHRSLLAGAPLWDAGYLATISAADLGEILRGDPADDGAAAAIPLFAERLANAREVGAVLLAQAGGQFSALVAAAAGDAVALARAIAATFPSFDDRATWDGRAVWFLKRAQILVADVAGCFADRAPAGLSDLTTFANLSELTAFADYKVPQLLRRLGMLDYTPDLAARVDRLELLPPGAPDEVALRAATVWGVELLRRALATRGVNVTASQIDLRLWLAGQTPDPADRPYHRTRTIFY